MKEIKSKHRLKTKQTKSLSYFEETHQSKTREQPKLVKQTSHHKTSLNSDLASR